MQSILGSIGSTILHEIDAAIQHHVHSNSLNRSTSKQNDSMNKSRRSDSKHSSKGQSSSASELWPLLFCTEAERKSQFEGIVVEDGTFDRTHLSIIHRKQLSGSPQRKSQILARLATEVPCRLQLPQTGQSWLKRIKINSQTRLQLRQKSSDFQAFEHLLNYNKLVKFIKFWKSQSDFDMLDVNDLVIWFGSDLDENAPGLLLEICVQLRQLILEFIDQTPEQLMSQGFKACKSILVSFENIKTEYNNRAVGLQRKDLSVLNYLISQIRFILSRFGRTITIYEVIAAKYKLTRGDFANDSSQIIQKHSTKLKTHQIENGKNLSNGRRIIVPTDISRDTSLPIVMLSTEEKTDAMIKQQFMLQRAVWREQYDQEKAQSVPTIVCRMCGQKFYADKSKQHSSFCIKKTEKLKEQRKLDQLFLQMSSKSTETMLLVQQENARNSNIATLLQTPTLQRRSFMAPKQVYEQPNQQQTNTVKPLNVLAQYAVNNIPKRQFEEQKGPPSKESIQNGLKNFANTLNMRDGNGNPLMTPQPLKAGLQSKAAPPQPVMNNYFNTLTQIRRDVPPQTAQTSAQVKPPQALQTLTPITNANTVQTQGTTPQPSIKAALESIQKQKLPKSPYLEAFQSRYKNVVFSQRSTAIHTTDPSGSSVKQGRRFDYWLKIQKQLNQSIEQPNTEDLRQIELNFEILNEKGGHMSQLVQRLQSLAMPKQTKKPEEPQIKIDTSKYANAFVDKSSFMPVCASPLITSSGRFQNQIQAQRGQVNSRIGGAPFDQKSQSSSLFDFTSKNDPVCATPMISSMNKRLQGKQDLDSLEVLKLLSNDAFNISINAEPISFQQQAEIFKVQSQKIAQMLTAANLNVKTIELLTQYKDLLVKKLEALNELIQIDRSYLITLPGTLQKQMKQEEVMNENKVKKMIDHINPQKAPTRRKESSQHLTKQKSIKELPSLGRSNEHSRSTSKETNSEHKKTSKSKDRPKNLPKSQFAKESAIDTSLRKLAEISDLSDEDHICPFQTLKKSVALILTFIFVQKTT